MKQYIDILNFTDCIEGTLECNRRGIYVDMEACTGKYLAFLFRAGSAVGPIFSNRYIISLPNSRAKWLMLHMFRLAPASLRMCTAESVGRQACTRKFELRANL